MPLSNIRTLCKVGYKDTTAIVTGAAIEKSVILPSQSTETEWTEGTGALAVNAAWTDTRTYNTSGTTLDLSSLPSASTNTGAAAFTAVKILRIKNNDATNTLVVGNAASQQFAGPLSAGTTTYTIPPGGEIELVNPSAAGWTTSSLNNLKVAAGASTVSGTITILGLS